MNVGSLILLKKSDEKSIIIKTIHNFSNNSFYRLCIDGNFRLCNLFVRLWRRFLLWPLLPFGKDNFGFISCFIYISYISGYKKYI